MTIKTLNLVNFNKVNKAILVVIYIYIYIVEKE